MLLRSWCVAIAALLCLYAAPASYADEPLSLVSWLEQVSEDGEEMIVPEDAIVEEEAFVEESAPSGDTSGVWSYPDDYQLRGIYPLDPVALDEWGSPAYCRSCNRPGCGPMGCGPCGGGCTMPTWYTEAEFVYLDRDTARPFNLSGYNRVVTVSGVQIPIPTPRLTTRNIGMNFEPGAKLTIGRFLGTDFMKRVHSLEFTYFGLFQWSGSEAVTGQTISTFDILGRPTLTIGNLFSFLPQGAAGFTGATVQAATYSSSLNSFEMNYRVRYPLGRDSLVARPDNSWLKRCTSGFTPSFLLGFRYLSIPEDFAFYSQGPRIFFNNGQPVSTSTASASYVTRTTNDLFGFQIGGDLTHQWCRWNVSVRGKAGLYGNWSTQTSVVSASEDPVFNVDPSRAFSADGQHAAFVGELGFTANYHVSQGMDLRAGYDFMWAARIAQAPLQLPTNFDTPPAVNVNGGTFFQGLSAGVEFFW